MDAEASGPLDGTRLDVDQSFRMNSHDGDRT